MLFKLYVAANADVLDDDLTAVDYHYLFNVPPESQECTSAVPKVPERDPRQELAAAARAGFAKIRASAASWPKTAVVRMPLDDSVGEYDGAAGAFPLNDMPPLSGANGPHVQHPPEPSGIAQIQYRGPVQEGCSASHMFFSRKAMPPPHFRIELKGGEHIGGVPMGGASAETYLQQHQDRRITIEVIAEVGPALLRPDVLRER